MAAPSSRCRNPLEALQRLAKWWRSQLSATVVAVVGSSGKTVTKDALVQILGADRHVFGTPGRDVVALLLAVISSISV